MRIAEILTLACLYGSVLSFDWSNSGRLAHQSDIEAELLWIEIKGVAVGGSNSSSDCPGACCRGNLSVKHRGALCTPAECKTKHSLPTVGNFSERRICCYASYQTPPSSPAPTQAASPVAWVISGSPTTMTGLTAPTPATHPILKCLVDIRLRRSSWSRFYDHEKFMLPQHHCGSFALGTTHDNNKFTAKNTDTHLFPPKCLKKPAPEKAQISRCELLGIRIDIR